MSLDQENFEKLEAYVDGTLDTEGRAQIQALLAGNPQLRLMMTELIAHRNLLRNLPRAEAPEDLMESFQGQLEREALLGQTASQSEPPHRVERWPRFVLAAAIFFMVLGLAGLVYEVLPKHRDTFPLVFGPGSGVNVGPDTESAGGATSEPSDKEKLSERLRAVPAASGPADIKLGTETRSANKSSATQDTDLSFGDALADRARPQISRYDLREAQKKLEDTSSTLPSDEPIVMVVRSEHPGQADAQISQFLQSNNIVYQTNPRRQLQEIESAQKITQAMVPGSNGSEQASPNDQQAQSADVAKSLPVTLPSQVATTQNNHGLSSQNLSGLANRNTPLAGPESLAGRITYRAMLTEQQLQRLNAQLLDQPNQWTEVRGQIVSDAVPPSALQNSINFQSRGASASGGAAPNFYGVVAKPATPPSTSPATTQASGALSITDGSAALKPEVGFSIDEAKSPISPTTQPTTVPTSLPSVRLNCVIIVSAEPVNFNAPATEPAASVATQPATQALPATQP